YEAPSSSVDSAPHLAQHRLGIDPRHAHVVDRALGEKAGRTGDVLAEHACRLRARRGTPRIGGSEQCDGRHAERCRQMGDTRVTAHEARQPSQEPGEERWTVAADERRYRAPRKFHDGSGHLPVFRRAEQEWTEPVLLEERGQAAEGFRRPELRWSECRAQVEPDHALARTHAGATEQRVDLPVDDRSKAPDRLGLVLERDAGGAQQKTVLVDLMTPRRWEIDHVSEKDSPRVGVESHATPGSPLP